MARKVRRAFFFCMMKCWLSEWLDFLFPEPVTDVAPDGCPSDDWTLPEIPECYRRNIPVLEPDTMTPKSADAYVRSRR
jgi:hypothetical protein